MLPNQVLNAIPRQKVRHVPSGSVAEVMDTTQSGTVLCVRHNPPSGSYLSHWITKDCEHVPEEPRGFRVGQPVAYELGPKARPDLIGITQYARIEAVQSDGCVIVAGTALRKEEDMPYLRHATPQELKDYFLND